MAETVHLFLKINGVEVHGETESNKPGAKDSIPCVFFDQSVTTARDTASGMTTGRRQYNPILIRKLIDKCSPLLFKALVDNQLVDAVFKFYRPNPVGDGTTEQYYTIEIKNGRIASMRNYLPDTITPSTANLPPLEEVTFVFHTISWTYTNGGVTHQDTWSVR